MPSPCICRLLVVGNETDLPQEHEIRNWITRGGGLYLELLLYDSERIAFGFETMAEPPLAWLILISQESPSSSSCSITSLRKAAARA